ncbi:hypothetical protein [Treponema sp.]|uniref:hypothetical protein n=1 Tax=Treponema sp. TaxID=166 RepID=UPI003890B41B
MNELHFKVNQNIVEQIVQQRTANLQNQLDQAQTDLEDANAQVTDLQMALCDVFEMISGMI